MAMRTGDAFVFAGARAMTGFIARVSPDTVLVFDPV